MIETNILVQVKLGKVLSKDGHFRHLVDQAIGASHYIVEENYVDESPGDRGDLKGEIRNKKIRELEYITESRATTQDGKPYPLFLFTGTGNNRGKADAGYTSGRVRATNNYGFGTSADGRKTAGMIFGMLRKKGKLQGIKPNKAADRAKVKSERPVVTKIEDLISRHINQ